MVKKRNKYTAEFKQEAVGLVMEHGYSYADAGRSLGVHGNMISRWKRELEVQGKHALIFPRISGHQVKNDNLNSRRCSNGKETK